jgi:hypothetical protein
MTGIIYGLLGLLAIALGGLITFALLERKNNREILAVRDLYETLDEQFDALEVDRNGLVVELAATRDLLKKERDLRASAESERNQCVREDRENTIKLIETSGIADAVALGNRILSAPMPGVRLSETRDGALEKP